MKVEIGNMLLNETVEFFFNLQLKGRSSRMRSKFIKILSTRLEEFSEQQQELYKEHCNLDESGEPKIIKNAEGNDIYDVKDLNAFAKDRQDLFDEKLVLEGGDNELMLKTVRTVLDECEDEMSGRKAVLYDHLCELFKVDEEIEEKTAS